MSDITAMDLAALSEAVGNKALSPVEITEAFLAAIERDNDRLNAFVTVTAEEAMAQAQAAEQEIMAGAYPRAPERLADRP